MQEAVIAQMIVDIGDEDGEGDAPPEFLDIRLRRRTMHAQRIDDLGIGMLAGFRDFDAEHRRGGDIHEPATGQDMIEAPNQGDGAALALNQAGFGGIDPRGSREPQREDLAFGDGAVVANDREFPDRQPSVVIHHRTVRAQSAQGGRSATEIAQILGRFGMRFHGMRRGQQMAKFDQRRHGSAPRLGRALEDAIFVLEAQCADAAYVVNRQEEVEGVQRTVLESRLAGC